MSTTEADRGEMDRLLALRIMAADQPGMRGRVSDGCVQISASELRKIRVALRASEDEVRRLRERCEALEAISWTADEHRRLRKLANDLESEGRTGPALCLRAALRALSALLSPPSTEAPK